MSHLLTDRYEEVKSKSDGRSLTAAAALNEARSMSKAVDSDTGDLWHGRCFLPSIRLTWPALDTAILRTCKSLYADGKRSLNSNSLMWLQLDRPQWQVQDIWYALRNNGIPTFRIRDAQAQTPAPVLIWKITSHPAQQDIPLRTHFAIPIGSLTRLAWLLNTPVRPDPLKGRIEIKYQKYAIPGFCTSENAVDKLYVKTVYPFLSNQITGFTFACSEGESKTISALKNAIKAASKSHTDQAVRKQVTDAAVQVWAGDVEDIKTLAYTGSYEGDLPWEVTLQNTHREISRTLVTLPYMEAAPESYEPYITTRLMLHFYGAQAYMYEACRRAEQGLDSYQNFALQAMMHANFVNSGFQEHFVSRVLRWDRTTPKNKSLIFACRSIILISMSLLWDANAVIDSFLNDRIYPDLSSDAKEHKDDVLTMKTAYLRKYGDNAQTVWNTTPSVRARFFRPLVAHYFELIIQEKWSGEYKLNTLNVPTLPDDED